ncbi:MAG: putative polymerase, sigma-24 subunit, subfamily, partial [Chloroflexi bacterium]|nr:putative polymerase, sigma-24 subunit, subfamily [Chloroflexota bacterium]
RAMTTLDPGVEDLLRRLAPRILGRMVGRYGQFDDCEDAVQEALVAAAVQWPQQGVPENPSAWLLTVAGRRLADEWRRSQARRNREAAGLANEPEYTSSSGVPGEEPSAGAEGDDTLKLLFLCCHPALSPSSQIALTLRAVGGLTTKQIAQAFLVPEATMAQRISRSKQLIKAAGARFVMAPDGERVQRLQAVLHVLYLIFNEGYTASSGPDLLRAELTTEAIRLTRALHEFLPDDGEVTGQLALMLLTDAHRASRAGPDGALIPLADQDRTLWNRAAIEEGISLVTDALTRSPPGPYQFQAAIAAVHAEAKHAEDTDWPQIVALYRLLSRIAPNPMVTLNQAVAVAMVDGPAAGLALLARLDDDRLLAGNHRLAAVRAHLLEKAGDHNAARDAFRESARLTTSRPEQRYLEGQAARLAQSQTGGNDMESTKTDTLKVPGAALYYEVQGSGPFLLLICGGIYDARTFARLTRQLADRHTVVTYDRRGNSRSPLDGPPEHLNMLVQVDDAHRLLNVVAGDQPADVFGNSSGAMIGLELAARHPEQVRTVVAHEPPIFELLPSRDYWREVFKNVEDTFAKEGAGPAMQVFNGGFGGEFGQGGAPANDGAAQQAPEEPGPEMTAQVDEHLAEIGMAMAKNMEYFIGYETPPVARYMPDFAALQASSARVVMAVGEASEGTPMYRATIAVAQRLGTQPALFPGDHGGFDVVPDAFAAKLHEVLSRS